MKTMNIILSAINTKHTHSALSLACIKSYWDIKSNVPLKIKEFDLNILNETIINELISNTMKLSKTYTSKNSLLVETISIKDLVDEVLSQFDSKISSKNLKIDLKISNSSIDTDKSRMKNAISCLIDNAVKYAISGSIVEISNASGILTITNSFNGQISNSDKLKEAFVRGDNSRKELDGSGLGLAISNNELKTLGFCLKIEIVDDKFIVKIVK